MLSSLSVSATSLTLRSTGRRLDPKKREIRLAIRFLLMKRLSAILIDIQIFKLSPRSTSRNLIP